MKTDLFQSCGHCWVFQICWHIECSTFTASSFRIWNSSTGIPLPPLALFVVMLPKAYLTSHSRMSSPTWVWVITPSWLSGSWRSFLLTNWLTHLLSNTSFLHWFKILSLSGLVYRNMKLTFIWKRVFHIFSWQLTVALKQRTKALFLRTDRVCAASYTTCKQNYQPFFLHHKLLVAQNEHSGIRKLRFSILLFTS